MRGSRAKGKGKIQQVLGEFKRGTLHSGSKSGPRVTSRRQAIAIAMRQSGAPPPRGRQALRTKRGRRSA